MTQTQRNQLADAYAFIAANPGCTAGEMFEAGHRTADWVLGLLEERGMIIRLANTPGQRVDSRFMTVRAYAKR